MECGGGLFGVRAERSATLWFHESTAGDYAYSSRHSELSAPACRLAPTGHCTDIGTVAN